MSMQAFMEKLKELKLKMAELENMEQSEGSGEHSSAVQEESPAVEKLEDKVDNLVPNDEAESEMDDDSLMEAFGKKKAMKKPGMKIAIAVGKSKGKPLFGKK